MCKHGLLLKQHRAGKTEYKKTHIHSYIRVSVQQTVRQQRQDVNDSKAYRAKINKNLKNSFYTYRKKIKYKTTTANWNAKHATYLMKAEKKKESEKNRNCCRILYTFYKIMDVNDP